MIAADPAAILAERWEAVAENLETWPGDHGMAWTGISGRAPQAVAPATKNALVFTPEQFLQDAHIGLVPAQSGAEALAVCGWSGALNHYSTTPNLPVIIRSWEQRFGFRLVGLSFDEMVGTVLPGINNVAEVAKELYAACPDMVDQNFEGDAASYVEYLDGNLSWYFWWD